MFQLVQGPILATKLLEHVYRKLTARGKADDEAEPAEYDTHVGELTAESYYAQIESTIDSPSDVLLSIVRLKLDRYQLA